MTCIVRGLIVCGLVVFFGQLAARGDDKEAAQQPSQAELEQLMEAYAQPGEAHERLQKMVGEWDVAVTAYEAGPDNPVESTAVAKMETMLEGRFLRQTFEGEFNGRKFTGVGISGYDNALKKYVGMWIDNFGTGIMHLTGEYDEETETLTETGKASTPLGEMQFKMVTKQPSDDSIEFTMYMSLPGVGEQKMMESKYTRRK
jgi:hypothetical protein